MSFPFYWTGCSEKFSLFASFLYPCRTSLSPLTTASQILQPKLIMYLFTGLSEILKIRRGKNVNKPQIDVIIIDMGYDRMEQ